MRKINCNPAASHQEFESKGRIMLIYTQRPGSGRLYQLTEPLGLNSLAAFVEKKGYGARVFSGPVHRAVTAVEHELRQNGLSAIGLYCDYENRSVVESFSRLAKETWGILVFVGGPQAVTLGKNFLKTSKCDAFVRGEGEYPLFELMEFFIHDRGCIEEIGGVSYLDVKNRMATVGPRAPIPDLDGLPIRKPGKDQSTSLNKGSLSLLTGRGCPFRCAFCYEGSVPGKVRLRSVDHVMTEIRQALRYNPEIKFVWFADDTFTLDPKRVESFCREIKKLRKDYDFVWFCECHPRTMVKWPDMLYMMLEAGLVRMQIGIESGSNRVLQLYRKKASLDQIESVVNLGMKAELPHLAGNVIIGGASETRSTFNDSKRFVTRLLELGPGMVDITTTFFLPLPKTAISCNPSDFGLKIIDERSHTSRGDVAVVETEQLSREQITAMRLEFASHVNETMRRLHREGLIPERRILKEFSLKRDYGLDSNWYNLVYAADEVTKDYYSHMAQGSIEHSNEIPERTLLDASPHRTARKFAHQHRRNLLNGCHVSSSTDGPFWIENQERSCLAGYTGTRPVCNGAFFSPHHELHPATIRSVQEVVEELRQNLARFPDLKFVHILDYDFSSDKQRSSQISRALGKLKEKRDFVWCCNCTAGSLVNSATLVAEMVANGLVRIEMAIEYNPPGGPTLPNGGLTAVDVERAVALCGEAGVSQTTGCLIMRELPRDMDELHRVLAWAETLLESAPGEFELNLKPLLPNENELAPDWHKACAGELKYMLELDDWGNGPDLPPDRSRHWPAFIKKEFYRRITEVMRKLLSKRRITRKTLFSHFVLYLKYGVESVWLKDIFKQYGILFNYYSLIADGAVYSSSDIEAENLSQWRPQRTMDLWLALDFSKGYPRIGRYVLSPLEYELLLYSSGKLTLSQLLETAYTKFCTRFENYAAYRETALSKLKDFESRHWLVYAEV